MEVLFQARICTAPCMYTHLLFHVIMTKPGDMDEESWFGTIKIHKILNTCIHASIPSELGITIRNINFLKSHVASILWHQMLFTFWIVHEWLYEQALYYRQITRNTIFPKPWVLRLMVLCKMILCETVHNHCSVMDYKPWLWAISQSTVLQSTILQSTISQTTVLQTTISFRFTKYHKPNVKGIWCSSGKYETKLLLFEKLHHIHVHVYYDFVNTNIKFFNFVCLTVPLTLLQQIP